MNSSRLSDLNVVKIYFFGVVLSSFRSYGIKVVIMSPTCNHVLVIMPDIIVFAWG